MGASYVILGGSNMGRYRHTHITVTWPVHRQLAELAAVVTGRLRRRVTLIDTLGAALTVAERHPDEMDAELARDD